MDRSTKYIFASVIIIALISSTISYSKDKNSYALGFIGSSDINDIGDISKMYSPFVDSSGNEWLAATKVTGAISPLYFVCRIILVDRQTCVGYKYTIISSTMFLYKKIDNKWQEWVLLEKGIDSNKDTDDRKWQILEGANDSIYVFGYLEKDPPLGNFVKEYIIYEVSKSNKAIIRKVIFNGHFAEYTRDRFFVHEYNGDIYLIVIGNIWKQGVRYAKMPKSLEGQVFYCTVTEDYEITDSQLECSMENDKITIKWIVYERINNQTLEKEHSYSFKLGHESKCIEAREEPFKVIKE